MDRKSLWLLSLLFKQVSICVSGCFAVFLCPAPAVVLGWFEVRPKNLLLYTDCDVLSLWWMVTEKPSYPICFSSYLLFSKNPDLVFQWIEIILVETVIITQLRPRCTFCVPFARWHSLRTHSMLYFLLWRPKSFPLPSLLDMLTLRSVSSMGCKFSLNTEEHWIQYRCI